MAINLAWLRFPWQRGPIAEARAEAAEAEAIAADLPLPDVSHPPDVAGGAAASLAQAWIDCNDPVYIGKITIALVEKCYSVISESPAIANHAARVAFAVQVTNGDTDGIGRRLARGAVSQGVPATSTDAQIRTLIQTDANFNIIAGIGQ